MNRLYLAIALILLTSLHLTTLGQNVSSARVHPDTLLNRLQKEDHEQRADIEKFRSENDRHYELLSNQIDFASFALGVFGLLFAVCSIWLGVHVSNVWKKIEEANRIQKEHSDKATQAESRAQELYDLMQNDMTSLYTKIRRSEVEYILKRLVDIPEDVRNVCRTLYSSELLPEDFDRLSLAFLNLNPFTWHRHKDDYLILLYQHFTKDSFLHEKIRPHLLQEIHLVIRSCFLTDLDKSMPKTIEALELLGIAKEYFPAVFSAVTRSNYGRDFAIYEILVVSLKTAEQASKYYDYLKPFEDSSSAEHRVKYLKSIIKCHTDMHEQLKEKLNRDLYAAEFEDNERIKELQELMNKTQ